jgi:diguanylate cyclase (GGDEF)-like protein
LEDKKTLTPAMATLAIVGVVVIADIALSAVVPLLGFASTRSASGLIHALLLGGVVAPLACLLTSRLRPPALKPLGAPTEAGQHVMTDPLTGLLNRRGITMALLDAMAQAQRYGHPLTVAMADVDGLARINETQDRRAGDKALALTAGILAEALRMPDKVGRYDGEAFLVILPHTALAPGRKIAERMRAAVEAWDYDLNGRPAKLTVSVGISEFSKGEDLEQLLSRLDKALSRAKTDGRNRVVAQKPTADRTEKA